jgi:hypothetical protein
VYQNVGIELYYEMKTYLVIAVKYNYTTAFFILAAPNNKKKKG